MQSYNTISRSTSGSVPMFLDGRIQFGVGISDMDMKEASYDMCGMCLEVTHIDQFYEWNTDLTEWNASKESHHVTAMVFDRCPDEVCIYHFLDFDIYHPKQPVFHGNPTHVQWHPIPCPVHEKDDYIEYLLCTSFTCNAQDIDKENTTVLEIIQEPVYFWTLTIRNMRYPIQQVWVEYEQELFELLRENAWTWNGPVYDLTQGIHLSFSDLYHRTWKDFISFSVSEPTTPGYHGGIIVKSSIQMDLKE